MVDDTGPEPEKVLEELKELREVVRRSPDCGRQLHGR